MRKCIPWICLIIVFGILIFYREKSETFIGATKNIELYSIQKVFNSVLEYLVSQNLGSYYIIKVNEIKSSGSKIKGDLMIFNKSSATVNRYNVQVSVPINKENAYVVDYVKFYNENNETYLENIEPVNLNSSNLTKQYYKAVKD